MPEIVATKLRTGLAINDAEFDRLYPEWARRLSRIHWTPMEAARRAAEWLVVRPHMRILDVGAGVGKFAVIASLTTQGHFFGIEQRLPFVRLARELAAVVGASQARFFHGNMMALDWSAFDAFYLYNPFAENLTSVMDPIDRTVDVEPSMFLQYVAFVQQQLERAAIGTRVVTYHGFGGDMPPAYVLERQERCLTDRLELWVKAR